MNTYKTNGNSELKLHEKIFVGSSVIFNLAVSGVYVASKIDAENLDSSIALKIFGWIVVLLIIPFTISLVGYIKTNAKKKIIISHLFIIFYLLAEILLDYILKIQFREILAVHIPYIIVFYAAAFSMIGVSRTISKKAGILVLSTFIMLIVCLIYNLSG